MKYKAMPLLPICARLKSLPTVIRMLGGAALKLIVLPAFLQVSHPAERVEQPPRPVLGGAGRGRHLLCAGAAGRDMAEEVELDRRAQSQASPGKVQ